MRYLSALLNATLCAFTCNKVAGYKRVKSSLLILALVLLANSQPLFAEVQSNIKVPVNVGVFIPCAAGGAGEVVFLTGDLHVLLRFTVTASGAIHGAFHFQPQRISGVGQTTGEKYEGTGITQDQFNARIGSEETSVNNFRIIGQGSGNNFLIHDNFHFIMHTNGATAFMDNFSVDCR
jgi:hypothetical protein